MVTPDAVNEMLDALWEDASVRCLEVDANRAVARIVPSKRNIRPGGFISGPAQFAAADSAFWFVVFGALGRIEPMALTSELSIRFLRPAVGEVLFAEATLDRLGKQTVVATVRVWTEDPLRPSAVAQGTYTLPRVD
jgi:uncharacterized protein (TIGR00369 family)